MDDILKNETEKEAKFECEQERKSFVEDTVKSLQQMNVELDQHLERLSSWLGGRSNAIKAIEDMFRQLPIWSGPSVIRTIFEIIMMLQVAVKCRNEHDYRLSLRQSWTEEDWERFQSTLATAPKETFPRVNKEDTDFIKAILKEGAASKEDH